VPIRKEENAVVNKRQRNHSFRRREKIKSSIAHEGAQFKTRSLLSRGKENVIRGMSSATEKRKHTKEKAKSLNVGKIMASLFGEPEGGKDPCDLFGRKREVQIHRGEKRLRAHSH